MPNSVRKSISHLGGIAERQTTGVYGTNSPTAGSKLKKKQLGFVTVKFQS